MLRTRLNNDEPWSEPEEFKTRKWRYMAAMFIRCFFGVRTWSYDESAKECREQRAKETA